jgi:hypothetical protein
VCAARSHIYDLVFVLLSGLNHLQPPPPNHHPQPPPSKPKNQNRQASSSTSFRASRPCCGSRCPSSRTRRSPRMAGCDVYCCVLLLLTCPLPGRPPGRVRVRVRAGLCVGRAPPSSPPSSLRDDKLHSLARANTSPQQTHIQRSQLCKQHINSYFCKTAAPHGETVFPPEQHLLSASVCKVLCYGWR